MDIEEIIKNGIRQERNKGWAPNGSADEMLSKVKAAYADLIRPCPFKVGDTITPKKVSTLKGRGKPYLIVEVLKATWEQVDDISRPVERSDMICLVNVGERYLSFYQASHQFELFDPKKVVEKVDTYKE